MLRSEFKLVKKHLIITLNVEYVLRYTWHHISFYLLPLHVEYLGLFLNVSTFYTTLPPLFMIFSYRLNHIHKVKLQIPP